MKASLIPRSNQTTQENSTYWIKQRNKAERKKAVQIFVKNLTVKLIQQMIKAKAKRKKKKEQKKKKREEK